MIVALEDLTSLPEFRGIPEKTLERKLKAIEQLIRDYTNNNFQNRNIRFQGESLGDRIFGSSPFILNGDTVQISKSKVNDGLFTITEVSPEGWIRLDRNLFDVPDNLVTKIEYPAVVQQGVIDLMTWEQQNRQRIGVKSETLSRHSVTYFDQDKTNQLMGYPVSLMGFLDPYRKPRF